MVDQFKMMSSKGEKIRAYRTGRRWSKKVKKAIGAGVRHDVTNKIAWSTRWAADVDALVRAEAQRTGKPMAAIIETLVREKLAP